MSRRQAFDEGRGFVATPSEQVLSQAWFDQAAQSQRLMDAYVSQYPMFRGPESKRPR